MKHGLVGKQGQFRTTWRHHPAAREGVMTSADHTVAHVLYSCLWEGRYTTFASTLEASVRLMKIYVNILTIKVFCGYKRKYKKNLWCLLLQIYLLVCYVGSRLKSESVAQFRVGLYFRGFSTVRKHETQFHGHHGRETFVFKMKVSTWRWGS